ncbi:MAG: hypothetical protein ACPGFA_07560, partial [Pikeienuella sp.]
MSVDPSIATADPTWERLSVGQGDIYGSHSRISALLRARLGPEAGGLLAEPVVGEDGALAGWRGPDGAALRPAANDAAHQALIAKAEGLAAQLDDQGDAGRSAAATIRSAMTTPTGGAHAYVNAATGAPVLVNWGMVAPGQARPVGAIAPEAPATVADSRPAPVSAAARVNAATAPAPTAVQARGFPWFMWLAPAALAGLLVWVGLQWLAPPRVETVEITPPAPPAYDPSDDIRDRIAALTSALDDVRDVQPEFQSACILPEPP